MFKKKRRLSKLVRHKSLRIKLLRILRPWHRRLGVTSALFIFILAITGVAINHSQDLNLADIPVTQGWLLDYYGIENPGHVAQFGTRDRSLLITDNLLWLENQQIFEAPGTLISATTVGRFVVAIDSRQLYLFDRDGQLQETQNSSTGLPGDLQAMAVSAEGLLWLKTNSGYYKADEQLLDWTLVSPAAPLMWLEPQTPIDPDVMQMARSAHLNWQRVIVDLHSGRLFGAFTLWIWDLFAIALLLVSFSGMWIWLKQTPSKH